MASSVSAYQKELDEIFGGRNNASGLIFSASCCGKGSPDDVFGFITPFVDSFMDDLDNTDPKYPFLPLSANDSAALTYTKLTDYLIAISKYNIDIPCYGQFIGYFSGQGGTDKDGNVYMLMQKDETSSEETKVFISEIIKILLTGTIKDKKFLIVLIFDISPHPNASIEGPPKLPTLKYDHALIVFSGLKEREANKDRINLWTVKFMEEFNKCTSENYSLIDGLYEVKNKFPDTQFTHTCGHILLSGDENFYNLYCVMHEKRLNDLTAKKGVMLVAQSADKRFDGDRKAITDTFDKLEFEVFHLKKSSDLLPFIKAISIFPYAPRINSFLSFYFSGYGGKDSNDRIYLQLEGEGKIYLDWILSLFRQRRYSHLPYFVLLELCLKYGPHSTVEVQLPVYYSDNCLVAMSGLHGDKISRTQMPEDNGKWTKKLCENIASSNRSFVDLLDVTGAKLQDLDTQYLNNLQDIYQLTVDDTPVTLATSKVKLPQNILYKKPLRNDIHKLLLGVASDWYRIGQRISVPNGTLDNIKADSKASNETKLLWMTDQVVNLTWARLLAALSSEKSAEIKAKLEGDPSIYCNYPD